MTFAEEYKKSLKMAEAEELLDLVFYRPIAFSLVKLIYRLPITPNQITFLSLLSGLAAAHYFSSGIPAQYTIAVLWYLVANVLDCSDGQLARLQGSGTPLGRIIDGVIDYIISVAVFASLAMGLTQESGNASIWYLVVAAGISSALHAIFFDYYQQEFISTVRGERNFLLREVEKFESEITELRNSKQSVGRRVLLQIYFQYLKVQKRSRHQNELRQQIPPELYRTRNIRIMRWWSFLGSTTNRSLLIVAGLFQQPLLFLWTVVVLGNAWFIVAFVWQRNICRQLEKTRLGTYQPEKEAAAKA